MFKGYYSSLVLSKIIIISLSLNLDVILLYFAEMSTLKIFLLEAAGHMFFFIKSSAAIVEYSVFALWVN